VPHVQVTPQDVHHPRRHENGQRLAGYVGQPQAAPFSSWWRRTGLWEITEDVPERDFRGSLQDFAGCVNQIVLHYTIHPQADAESKPGLLLPPLITAERGFVDFSILHYDKEIVGRVFDQLDNRFRNRASKNPGKRL